MNATARRDLIPVEPWTDPETGNLWLHVLMAIPYTYAQYSKLPKVLEHEGKLFVQRGWSSDSGRVSYLQSSNVAQGA
jgi:hypothetical protein